MKELSVSYILKYKERLILSAKVLLAAGLIWYIISVIDFGEIIEGIRNAKMLFITAAFLLSGLNLYLQYLKWKVTCQYLINENHQRRILFSLFYGLTGGAFTPVRVGEYFGRAIAFKDVPLLKITAATFIDKLFSLFMTAFFGSMAAILFINYYYHVSPYLTGSLFILLFVLFSMLLYLLMNINFRKMLIEKIRGIKILGKYLNKIGIAEDIDKGYFVKMIFLSMLFYLCIILQFALLAEAFSWSGGFINFIWAGNLVMFAKTIIPAVSLGELGIREGASVFFIQALGSTAAAGFNASIFIFIINIVIPSLAGMFLMFKRNDT